MNDTKPLWDDVARDLESLALKLKLHYEENVGEVDRAELDTALRELGKTLQASLRSVGDAVRDPAVHEDVNRLGTSLGDALSKTFSQVGDDVRAALAQRKGDDD
ncbi:MAG TPA: hypothetical protein VFT31_06700 [Kribbella sp.]|nr:hypothetical protein [Kribbella sp.]